MRNVANTPAYRQQIAKIGSALDNTLAAPRQGNGGKDLLAMPVSDAQAEYAVKQVAKLPGWSLQSVIRKCATQAGNSNLSADKRKAYKLCLAVAKDLAK